MTDIYRKGLRWLLIATLLTLLSIMGLQIFCRYALNASLIWAEEMCRYLLVWVSFLACAEAYERGEIAAVPILRDALPRRAGLALAILVNLLAIALMGTLTVYGLRYADMIGQQPIPAARFLLNDLFGAPDLAPAMFWVFAALPVGLSILTVRLAIDVVLYTRMFAGGGNAADLRAPAGLEDVR